MPQIKNPAWIDSSLFTQPKSIDPPDDLIEEINARLDQLTSENPTVSVVIPAWNEEANIVRTIYFLSKSECTYPVEIIVVNNNSTDTTQQKLDRLHIKSFVQPKQGCGPARQLGQEKAKGKYILMADADCYYPKGWIQSMTHALEKKGVICVYGHYSFLGGKERKRLSFFFYECLRDVLVELRHANRPYLNALGMTMGYVKEFGLKVGFVDKNIRGEDGRMCFDLMQFGKVSHVKGAGNRVWTLPRTLEKEGNLLMSVVARVLLETSRLGEFFYKMTPHNTKTSKNSESFLVKYFKKYKSVHKADNN